jgi:hypothetical protein
MGKVEWLPGRRKRVNEEFHGKKYNFIFLLYKLIF